MTIQFGPERLLINIDKNTTKIPHHGLRFVEYNADGDLVILRIQTEDQLPSTSKLEPYYDPAPSSGKAKRIILFIKCDALFIEEQLRKLSEKGVNTSHLSSEIAAKIRSLESRRFMSWSVLGLMLLAHPLAISKLQTERVNAIKPIQSEDISRLNEGEFLNDTLIEFGLKHVYANVEARNPDLADKTYIFNSFFYERLLTKSGLHWYLAIITNPGLLLKTEEDIEPSSGSQMSLSYLDFDSNVSIDDIVSPSLTNGDASKHPEELERGNLVRNESSVSQETPPSQRHDDGPGPQKRKLRSMTPSVVTPVDPEERPYIIVLDSLGGTHPGVFRSLRLYLQQELLTRKNIERTIDSKDVPGKLAKCPQQENFCDCGLFLLHYAEVFLKHPGPMLNGIVNKTDDMNRYWSVGDLAQKREKYREIMISLTEEYKSYLFSQKQIEQIKEANQHSNQSLNNER
ncbi:hypothetical protein BGX20_008092 [Mortierella sp. AD010]|nr:hypothetical protein BGX20_008092 [Mortierella sp. AD010]